MQELCTLITRVFERNQKRETARLRNEEVSSLTPLSPERIDLGDLKVDRVMPPNPAGNITLFESQTQTDDSLLTSDKIAHAAPEVHLPEALLEQNATSMF